MTHLLFYLAFQQMFSTLHCTMQHGLSLLSMHCQCMMSCSCAGVGHQATMPPRCKATLCISLPSERPKAEFQKSVCWWQEVVYQQQLQQALPIDPGAAYVVVTTRDVGQTDFCTSACGWHDFNSTIGLCGPLLDAVCDVIGLSFALDMVYDQ